MYYVPALVIDRLLCSGRDEQPAGTCPDDNGADRPHRDQAHADCCEASTTHSPIREYSMGVPDARHLEPDRQLDQASQRAP